MSQSGRGGADRRRLVLVTGLSGAGRTTSLKILEDLGFEAVDNLPLTLLEPVVRAETPLDRPLAVGIDIRTRDFSVQRVTDLLDRLDADPSIDSDLLFIDCDDEVLLHRFTETRRRHPLATDRPVTDGIRLERNLVSPLRARANVLVDTSKLSAADLRRQLHGLAAGDGSSMALFVTSFSYRHGLPREADLVFDARFLRNPHYDDALRSRTGRDPDVAAYIEADEAFGPFLDHLQLLLEPLVPRYEREGKSYLTLAVGCTGGQHRSVLVAERLAAWLTAQGRAVTLEHRDMPPDAAAQPAAPVRHQVLSP